MKTVLQLERFLETDITVPHQSWCYARGASAVQEPCLTGRINADTTRRNVDGVCDMRGEGTEVERASKKEKGNRDGKKEMD